MTKLEVKEIMAGFFDISLEKITDSSSFKDLGLDYIDCFELICELETIYKVDIPYSKEHANASVGRFIDSLLPL